MKWAILLGLVFLTACVVTIEKPVACTMDAKKCPDGSFVGRIAPDCEFEACPVKEVKERVYCTPEQKKGEMCIEIYQPVCGWNDPEKIQCIKYPCASTYSNSCFACIDENVLYYTEGECPE